MAMRRQMKTTTNDPDLAAPPAEADPLGGAGDTPQAAATTDTAADPQPGAPDGTPDEVIALPETVDLPRAGDLYERLAAREGHPVVIDAARVQFIGTPALQVLLAAATTWRRGGTGFELRDPSAGFLACIARLGVDPAALITGTPA